MKQSSILLLFCLIMIVRAQPLPEKTFTTPEAALQHFVESIKANDVGAALGAFAVNEQAENLDFAAYTERVGAFSMAQTLSPSEYAMYADLNRLELTGRYANQIKFFSYSLLLQTNEMFEEFDPYRTIPVMNEPAFTPTFIKEINPEKLSGLTISKVFRITTPSGRLLENWQAQAKPLGADEITELVILYELGGNFYLGGARVLRYGETWKLDALSSAIAGTEAGGNTRLTTQAEFEWLIDGLSDSENWKLEEIEN